jgi:hypothetical protein
VTRPILVSTVALTLVLGGILAPAASSHRAIEPAVSFGASYIHGQPVKVRHFVYSNVAVSCNEGAATANNFTHPLPAMKIDHRTFEGSIDHRGRQVELTGRYNKQLTKIKGTLRVQGNVAGLTGCDSGRLRWKAHSPD